MIGLVPNIFCGGYTYERVVIFGSIWTIQSLIAIIVIVVKNIQNFLDDVYYPFSNVFQGSLTGVILVCFLLITHAIVSSLVFYGAKEKKRFYLIPWLVQSVFSITITIAMLAPQLDYFYNEDFQVYFICTASFQAAISVPIIKYFFMLRKEESESIDLDSEPQVPYDKMTSSVA